MQEYVHYGAAEYVREKFQPVRNKRWRNKPEGGLWASAVDAPFGWKAWNESAECRDCSESCCFRFHLSDDARILVIDSVDAACALPERIPSDTLEYGIRVCYPVLPDFEKLFTMYDAIDFRISEDRGLYRTMYSWDCDSLLVMNPDVIREDK